MAGLYIHIPFCRQACYYCDFHFSTNLSYRERMVACIAKEVGLNKKYQGSIPLETIYFGGGTPSILRPVELEKLMRAVTDNYEIVPDPEITIEANPDDLTLEKLRFLKALGINRLSIGVQSFQDEILKTINRAHSADVAVGAFANARKAGFDNISIDLIFAFPGTSILQLDADIQHAAALDPEHISVYHLTIEEKTVFGNWQKKGKLSQLAEDEAASHFEYLIDALSRAGYEQYEISNFCRDSKYSRHNTSYWKNKTYLGVGPGAHSYDGCSRQYNVLHNHHYMKALEADHIPAIIDVTDQLSLANDYLLASLRTKWGCDLREMSSGFHLDFLQFRKDKIVEMARQGYLIHSGSSLILTAKGRMLADSIIAELMLD